MKTPPIAPLLLALALGGAAGATESTMNAGELAHALDRLAHTDRVLYIAAHPDDENTRLLAYLANGRHATVAYLSMTRGGGGQNLIGSEQGDLLDVIRTEELLAARRLDGAEQRFTRMRDFGYSKNAQETLALWGHQEALADVVWVLRTFQPDVIITRFDENPGTHGHHTASSILAREAFAAAADPKRFPEQLARGAKPWQAKRLVWNFAGFSGATPPAGALELDVGGYDARLGQSYGELAAVSRSQHKSQGFGVSGERGRIVERFVAVAGTAAKSDVLEGVETGWGRFGASGAPLGRALDEARAALDRDHPERALPALARAARALDAFPDEPRVRDARRALARIAAATAGLYVRATAPRGAAVPGDTVDVSVELVLRSPAKASQIRVTLPGAAPVDLPGLARGEKKVVPISVPLAADAPVSVPYWLFETPEPGRYRVRDASLVGMPRTPPALAAGVDVTLEGATFHLEAPVVHTWTDDVQGERVRELVVLPPATVNPTRTAVLAPNGRPAPLQLRVRAAHDGVKAEVGLSLPPGWKAAPAAQPIELAHAGDEIAVRFDVTPPAGAKEAARAIPELRVGGKTWSYREDTIDHAHIPFQTVVAPATARVVPIAIKLPAGLVGYIPGSGDSVADDLTHVGMKVAEIDAETLRTGDLSRFSAILVGIRAFNVRADVRAARARLMAYVERGGSLVVQYNTNSRFSPLEVAVGPYPLEIGRDRVTDESAAMTPVAPDHPALRAPNRIGPADFEGWVQERGIYFATKWDDRYQPLFRVADPGESPVLGSTVVARYGKGRYVYTGLVFFRQLPAGVPGAYRLLVNLLAGS